VALALPATASPTDRDATPSERATQPLRASSSSSPQSSQGQREREPDALGASTAAHDGQLGLVELYEHLSTAVGENGFDSVDRFLNRRNVTERKGWVRAMLKEIGPGSPNIPSDLIGACDDDEINSIASPPGLRAFVAKRQRERVAARHHSATAPSKTIRSALANAGEASYAAGRAAFQDTP
jgi:hypothetical protein